MKKDKAARKAEFKAKLKRQLISLIGPCAILAVIVAGILVIAFYKNASEKEELVVPRGYAGEEKSFVLENDDLKFVLDPETTQFKVQKKSSKREWLSNPNGIENDSLSLKLDKEKLQSTLILTSSTDNGLAMSYNNYAYSMTNHLYEIEQTEDAIRVKYSLGEVEKEFVIPPVIRKDRLEELLSGLDKGSAAKITDYYKKYDINKLGKKDNKEELLANYPILETQVIYVLRDTTKDNMKKKLEEYFAEMGYTYEEYLEDKALDMRTTSSDKPVFNLTVEYRLEGNDLVVSVPLSEMEYPKKCPVYQLNLLPFFGAGSSADEGYMLVPEGGGALINFNNGKVAQSSYYANMYGWDMCEDRKAVVHETQTYFNAFGIANGADSFICILEEGAPYAAIQADISGKTNGFNSASVVYSLLHRDQYDVGDRTTVDMYVYEDQLPDETLTQRYCFLDTNDYVDMAKEYGSYMEKAYPEYLVKKEDTSVPVAVEIIGAVDKVKQVMGVPVSKPLKLTSFNEANDIVTDLANRGFENVSVKYIGWCNGGVEQKMLNKVKPVKDLGTKKQLANMISSANALGIPVYLDAVTNYAYNNTLFDGFSEFTDSAKFVSKERAKLHPFSTITYDKLERREPYYLLKGETILEMADNLVEAANKYNAEVSFSDYGYQLSSDYNKKNLISREQTKRNQSEQMKGYVDAGKKLMINMGNDYAIPYAALVTNMDLEGSNYTIIDEKIPFYQIAMHGLVNYTGEALTLTQNKEDEVLRSAEYGAGLCFSFMKESPFALQSTYYTRYFGAGYDDAIEESYRIYARYNEELGHTFSQRMVGHEKEGSVACTTYEDGTKVYVNYSYETMKAVDGTEVPARDYVVKK